MCKVFAVVIHALAASVWYTCNQRDTMKSFWPISKSMDTLLFWSTAAPAVRSLWTTSMWPMWHANIRAVHRPSCRKDNENTYVEEYTSPNEVSLIVTCHCPQWGIHRKTQGVSIVTDSVILSILIFRERQLESPRLVVTPCPSMLYATSHVRHLTHNCCLDMIIRVQVGWTTSIYKCLW